VLKRARVFAVVLLLATTFAAAGCASFKQNRLPEISGFGPAPAESTRPSVTYSLAYTYKLAGEGQGPESARALLSREFAQVLTESAQFSNVSESAGGGDLHVDAQIHNSGNPAAMIPAFITGFSLFTIPSWATDHWRLTATVHTSGGDPRSYSFEDSDLLVQWLPMIFATPFKFPGTVIPEVRRNMYRNLVKSMKDNGDLSMP
jgi:hypothetical protein